MKIPLLADKTCDIAKRWVGTELMNERTNERMNERTTYYFVDSGASVDRLNIVTHSYGVLKEDEGIAFRGLFIIDPNQVGGQGRVSQSGVAVLCSREPR